MHRARANSYWPGQIRPNSAALRPEHGIKCNWDSLIKQHSHRDGLHLLSLSFQNVFIVCLLPKKWASSSQFTECESCLSCSKVPVCKWRQLFPWWWMLPLLKRRGRGSFPFCPSPPPSCIKISGRLLLCPFLSFDPYPVNSCGGRGGGHQTLTTFTSTRGDVLIFLWSHNMCHGPLSHQNSYRFHHIASLDTHYIFFSTS